MTKPFVVVVMTSLISVISFCLARVLCMRLSISLVERMMARLWLNLKWCTRWSGTTISIWTLLVMLWLVSMTTTVGIICLIVFWEVLVGLLWTCLIVVVFRTISVTGTKEEMPKSILGIQVINDVVVWRCGSSYGSILNWCI